LRTVKKGLSTFFHEKGSRVNTDFGGVKIFEEAPRLEEDF
jgi:hypothetical protein